jgi:hypothetical protein
MATIALTELRVSLLGIRIRRDHVGPDAFASREERKQYGEHRALATDSELERTGTHQVTVDAGAPGC